MFLLDDLLLLPFRSVTWLARKVSEAAAQELAAEEKAITEELGRLYQMLEAGKMTEEEFDERESALLDRLDEIQKLTGQGEADA